jgi:hypothetical protein
VLSQADHTITAAHRVFAMPELAEMIFMELSFSDVLVNVQRVCREWKGVIGWSLPVQQALFMRPISSD